MEVTDYEIPTIEDIFYLSLEVAKKILKDKRELDCLIGISRGGLIPTRLLSDFLSIKDVRVIRSIYYTGTGETLERPIVDLSTIGDIHNLKVLIVDDVADTGDTLIEVKKEIMNRGASEAYIATLYVKPWRKIHVDYYAAETDKWIVFPWEIREIVEDLMSKGKGDTLLNKVRGRKDFNEVLGIIHDNR